jgi:hypothetical protein
VRVGVSEGPGEGVIVWVGMGVFVEGKLVFVGSGVSVGKRATAVAIKVGLGGFKEAFT